MGICTGPRECQLWRKTRAVSGMDPAISEFFKFSNFQNPHDLHAPNVWEKIQIARDFFLYFLFINCHDPAPQEPIWGNPCPIFQHFRYYEFTE
jgi:hypothetical protein